MNMLRIVLVLCLIGAGCSDDSQPSDPNNTNNINNTNNANSDADMADTGNDTSVDPDIPKTPGQLVIDTDIITFEGVRVGEEKRVSIALRNLGGQDIIISDVAIGEINRRGDQEILKGSTWIDGITILEAGTFKEIEVLYKPTDEETDRGIVTINSNDATNPVTEIRIETTNPYQDIEAPRLLKFGYVENAMASTKRILLYNRGSDPLTIQSAVKTGLGPFTVAFVPNEAPPNVIEKDEAFAIDVTFTPNSADTARATITVVSDDPGEPSIDIAVNGNDPTACISLTPRVGDFGEVAPNAVASKEMTLFNCSNVLGLEVSNIELVDDGGGVFSLEGVPTLPLNMSGFETQMFTVKATLDAGERVGEVLVESNDAAQSPMRVELRVRTPVN